MSFAHGISHHMETRVTFVNCAPVFAITRLYTKLVLIHEQSMPLVSVSHSAVPTTHPRGYNSCCGQTAGSQSAAKHDDETNHIRTLCDPTTHRQNSGDKSGETLSAGSRVPPAQVIAGKKHQSTYVGGNTQREQLCQVSHTGRRLAADTLKVGIYHNRHDDGPLSVSNA